METTAADEEGSEQMRSYGVAFHHHRRFDIITNDYWQIQYVLLDYMHHFSLSAVWLFFFFFFRTVANNIYIVLQ